MSLDAIEKYFSDRVYKPFFAAVGDGEYLEILSELERRSNIKIIHLSKYCKPDKKPDLDRFKDALREADVDCNDNKLIVLGLGEYLALEGATFADKVLNELKDFSLGTARAVLLLRGVINQVQDMVKSDLRMMDRQISIGKVTDSEIKCQISSMDLQMYDIDGFKKMLEHLEAGDREIRANTSLAFPDSLFPVQVLEDSYQAIRKKYPAITLLKTVGEEDDWKKLLQDLNTHKSIEKVFENYNISHSDGELYDRIFTSDNYLNWLHYLYLRINNEHLQNKYLQYVLTRTKNFAEFKSQILNAISQISHKDGKFSQYYSDRKKLLKSFPEAEIAEFINQNRRDPEESIYKLTDATLLEREEIIAEIAQHGIPKELDTIYPDLALYLKSYSFGSGDTNAVLTQYFDDYRRQKVTNTIEPEFLEQVDCLAQKRIYNELPARDSLLPSSSKENNTFLCWIDALGAEFAGYISQLAEKRGLNISIRIGRANLPTITEFNRQFYEDWPTELRRKIDTLDELIHGSNTPYPQHLARELKLISDLFENAKTQLALGKYKSYVFAGDHGASRLAVLHKKEEKYEAETKGEHSGRCCKLFDAYNHDLKFACEDNGYIVLADYGRFKFSHAGSVEMHGGAALEEVVVPVIILSLKDSSIKIELLTKKVKADYKTGVKLEFFVMNTLTDKLSVIYDNKKYESVQTDDTHYSVAIPDIKRSGTYDADVYVGDKLTSHIEISAESKSAAVNNDFDLLFR